MLRFQEMPFSKRPETDGFYIVQKADGARTGYSFTPEGGWNTHRSCLDNSVDAEYAFLDEEMEETYIFWLKPIGEESLTPWMYDQLIEELVIRCAMALDSKEQEMQAHGATKDQIEDATYYLVKSIEYLKRMMSMLEGEIN